MQHFSAHWSIALFIYGVAVLVTGFPMILSAAKNADSKKKEKILIRFIALGAFYAIVLLCYRFIFL